MLIKIWTKSIQDENLKNVLRSFNTNDDKCEIVDELKYTPGADADVILGSWKQRDVEHHNLKREIVNGSKHVVVLETPLLERGPVKEVMEDEWFRVGLNGFMRNGQFCSLTQKRRSFSIHDKTVYPRRITGGDYILVVMQLPGDASLDFVDINQWASETTTAIRKLTDRDIVIRFPQLKRDFNLDFIKDHKHMYIQQGTFKDKQVTLDNAYAVFTYSSGMGVEAILNGNRTYVGSRNGFYSKENVVISDVLEKDYQNFGNLAHQLKYIEYLKSTQWHRDEIKSGECWNGIKELING